MQPTPTNQLNDISGPLGPYSCHVTVPARSSATTKTAFLLLAALLVSSCAILDQSWRSKWDTRWVCDDLTLYIGEPIIIGPLDITKGLVDFDGLKEEIEATYSVDGLAQRWTWYKDDTQYAVVLKQGHSGMVAFYHDFSLADEDGVSESTSTFYNCYSY